MTTCAGCGSEIRGGRCPTCSTLSMSYILEQEALEDYRPEPLTEDQQTAHDTLLGWLDEWEQERQEAESQRMFATGH